MKIMLATPPTKERAVHTQYIPLGLAYLTSVLLKEGHEVEVVDVKAEKLSENEIIKRIENFKPELFGVTSTTSQIHDAVNLLNLVKNNFPYILTVIGGAHVSALPQISLKEFPSIDIGIIGEGEITIIELIKNIIDKNNLQKVQGIVYRDNQTIVTTDRRNLIEDLDSVPFPVRNIFPLKIYDKYMAEYKKKPVTSMITSRGCPYGCIFCCKATFGSKYRPRSINNVIKEIEHLYNVENYREIHIFDDNFSFDMERAKGICNEIIKRNMKINFVLPNGIHIKNFNEELAILMRKAGFYYLWFGVESGDPEVLRKIRKGITIEQISNAVKIAKKFDFFTGMFFVIGLPGSNPDSELKSLQLAKKLEPDVLGVSIFTAYPGSPVYNYSAHLDWQYYRHDFSEHHFTGTNFDEKYILKQFDTILHKFYFRPIYYYKLIKKHKFFALRRTWINFKNFLFRRFKI